MTILANDIKLRASKVMADVPEGGGGPSAAVIEWGQSNTVFDDIDSVSRTLGNVSVRQLHMHVDTPNTDKLLGAHAIVARLPADPNVSVTLAACGTFARRSEIASAIANYLIQGVPWAGFLLGNHVAGQGNIQLFQRPGSRVPTIGRTLALVVDEGLPTEAIEWVRVIKVESSEQTFTYIGGSTPINYQALVVTCEIASPLSRALPGTDPNLLFAMGAGKTKVRDTTTADAANYYGASAITVAANIGALTLKTASAYSQLVPSSATPVPSLNQRPAAQRVIQLASSPRAVTVPATPHAARIKVTQENRTLSYVGQMLPVPAPGTVVVTWVGLGNRYTIEDDGAGQLSGPGGVGTVDYVTGSWSVTLPSLPDVGSAILTQWGECVAYTNRSGQGASVKRPEYTFILNGSAADGTGDEQVVPGSVTIEYTSALVVKTVTDNGTGGLTGDGTGAIDYIGRRVVLRPSAMPDAGAEFDIDYQLKAQAVETLAPGTPSTPGGNITLTLADTPVAGSVQIEWSVLRTTSASSGIVPPLPAAASKVANEDQHVIEAPAAATPPSLPSGGHPWVPANIMQAVHSD